MADGALNPYRYTATMLRSQLRIEQMMSEDARKATMWQALVQFSGTQFLLGRGGVNTCFYAFGAKGKRRYDYPAKVLVMLDKLASQPFPLYHVQNRNGEVVQRSFFLQRIRDLEPQPGEVVYGIPVDGEPVKVFRARSDVRGRLAWLKI